MKKIFFFLLLLILISSPDLTAQIQTSPAPTISLNISGNNSDDNLSLGLQIALILTLITLAPALLIMLTSFTRIIIIFSFLRQAMSVQQVPPNQILIGLSLFLTFFIMSPIFKEVNQEAFQPYINKEITIQTALKKAEEPVRKFMIAQIRKKDLAFFVNVSKIPRPETIADIPTTVIIPAFIISELKTAFIIGFLLYIPFLILDMVVASLLLSMGMIMLPPVVISLPFKLLLFVLVDGWYLICGSIINSFQ